MNVLSTAKYDAENYHPFSLFRLIFNSVINQNKWHARIVLSFCSKMTQRNIVNIDFALFVTFWQMLVSPGNYTPRQCIVAHTGRTNGCAKRIKRIKEEV
jgi:hypothetical protein